MRIGDALLLGSRVWFTIGPVPFFNGSKFLVPTTLACVWVTHTFGGRAAPKTTRVAARAASRATHHPGKEASSQSRTLWIKTRTAVVRKLNQEDPEGATALAHLLDKSPQAGVQRGS